MTDLTQGIGFNIPNSYEELVNQFSDSKNDKLQQIAQVLAIGQMTHTALMNVKGYRNMLDSIGKTIFDPFKADLESNVINPLKNVMGSLPISEGQSSLSLSDFADMLKNAPSRIGQMIKAKISQAKQFVKDKIDSFTKSGDENVFNDFSINGEEPIIPFQGKDQLMSGIKQMATKLKISDNIVNDLNDVISQRVEDIPQVVKSQLKQFGISDEMLSNSVSENINARSLSSLVEAKNNIAKFADPFESESLPSSNLAKSYRASKLLSKLQENPEESGFLRGDSIIARVKNEASSQINRLSSQYRTTIQEGIDESPILRGAQTSVSQIEAKVSEFKNIITNPSEIESAIRTNISEISPLKPLSSITQEFENIGSINLQNTLSNTIKNTILSPGLAGEISSGQLSVDNVVNKTASVLSKVKDGLTKADIDTSELDESPLGPFIEVGLALATIGTSIAGLFEKKPQGPIIAQGEQYGV